MPKCAWVLCVCSVAIGENLTLPLPPQEIISRQMNSVFKELLSRQSPGQQPTFAAPAPPVPSSSSSSSSLPQVGPAAKKVGFGLKGRTLFRAVD